jgi:hypothetical protein
VSRCFYTQPVWKKQTALKNGLSAAANEQVNARCGTAAQSARAGLRRARVWRRGTLESTHRVHAVVRSERRRPAARSLKTARTGLCKWVRLRCRRRFPSDGADYWARTGARCERADICLPDREKGRARVTPPFSRTFVNDPSAGSPTDTLLRLLRPLPHIICPTSQPNDHGQADHGTHPYRSLTGTIGRSDGRCVQRAGTLSTRANDSRLLGIPHSWGTIAMPNPWYERGSADFTALSSRAVSTLNRSL